MMHGSISLESRFVGAYLGLAIGDALGATVEFLTPQEIQQAYDTHREICGGGWLKLKAGQVTDDTTMALALGQSLIQEGKVNALAIAEGFSEWMRNKPVDIGNTVRRGIVHYRTSGEVVSPESEFDAGNGACMRCLPIALQTFGVSKSAIQTASRSQAHITHHNTVSDAGTECIIFMLHGMMQGKSKAELLSGCVADLIKSFPQFAFHQTQCSNPSGYIVDTLQAVFQSFFDTDDFESCLIDVVNRGGDADTTGAIAGMLAGCLYGVEAIPAGWLNRLDTNIRQACEQQAKKFYALLTTNKSVAFTAG